MARFVVFGWCVTVIAQHLGHTEDGGDALLDPEMHGVDKTSACGVVQDSASCEEDIELLQGLPERIQEAHEQHRPGQWDSADVTDLLVEGEQQQQQSVQRDVAQPPRGGAAPRGKPAPRRTSWDAGTDQTAANARTVAASKPGPTLQQCVDDTRCFWGEYWGISRDQLKKLVDDIKVQFPRAWSTMDMNAFNDQYIKPQKYKPAGRTDNRRIGYSLYQNEGNPRKINVMISHSWEEPVVRFLEDVISQIRPRDSVYICTLANYQGTEAEGPNPMSVSHQLGQNPIESPFAKAINSAKEESGYFLAISNDQTRDNGGLYHRMWCVWELYLATLKGLPIRMMPGKAGPKYLFGSDTGTSVAAPECGTFHNRHTNRDEPRCYGVQAPGTARSGPSDEVVMRDYILKRSLAEKQKCKRDSPVSRCDPFIQVGIVAYANSLSRGTAVITVCEAYDTVAAKDKGLATLCGQGVKFNTRDTTTNALLPGGLPIR